MTGDLFSQPPGLTLPCPWGVPSQSSLPLTTDWVQPRDAPDCGGQAGLGQGGGVEPLAPPLPGAGGQVPLRMVPLAQPSLSFFSGLVLGSGAGASLVYFPECWPSSGKTSCRNPGRRGRLACLTPLGTQRTRDETDAAEQIPHEAPAVPPCAVCELLPPLSCRNPRSARVKDAHQAPCRSRGVRARTREC